MSSITSKNVLNSLKGIVCLYKSPDTSVQYLSRSFRDKLCKDVNRTHTRLPISYLDIDEIEKGVSINVRPSYADNILASGPRHSPDDLAVALSPIGKRTSGVCVSGINDGIKYMHLLRKINPIKVMQVKGVFGEATQYFYKNEKIVAKASIKRVHRNTVDKVISSFQSAHQRKLLLQLGINIQSEEAYELATQGLLRPQNSSVPFIYSIKCIEFDLPNFTLELICINENENYLLKLIHDFGLQLRTFAHCTGIRCIRYGPFAVRDSLIQETFSLNNVIENMKHCKLLMKQYKYLKYSPHLRTYNENKNTKSDVN